MTIVEVLCAMENSDASDALSHCLDAGIEREVGVFHAHLQSVIPDMEIPERDRDIVFSDAVAGLQLLEFHGHLGVGVGV